MRSVLLVGMGTIGRTHAEVLGEHDAFDPVGVVDVRSDHVPVGDTALPVFAELGAALTELSPELAVVATPTGTHVAVLEQILEGHPSCAVLVEKPAAASAAERAQLERLLARHGERQVLFAHHTAYAPGAKSTRLTYDSGVEILLDHTGVSAFVTRDGRVVARFGTDGARSRRDQHYRNLYDAVAGDPDALLSWPTTRRLLHALLAAEDPNEVGDTVDPARPRWSAIRPLR